MQRRVLQVGGLTIAMVAVLVVGLGNLNGGPGALMVAVAAAAAGVAAWPWDQSSRARLRDEPTASLDDSARAAPIVPFSGRSELKDQWRRLTERADHLVLIGEPPERREYAGELADWLKAGKGVEIFRDLSLVDNEPRAKILELLFQAGSRLAVSHLQTTPWGYVVAGRCGEDHELLLTYVGGGAGGYKGFSIRGELASELNASITQRLREESPGPVPIDGPEKVDHVVLEKRRSNQRTLDLKRHGVPFSRSEQISRELVRQLENCEVGLATCHMARADDELKVFLPGRELHGWLEANGAAAEAGLSIQRLFLVPRALLESEVLADVMALMHERGIEVRKTVLPEPEDRFDFALFDDSVLLRMGSPEKDRPWHDPETAAARLTRANDAVNEFRERFEALFRHADAFEPPADPVHLWLTESPEPVPEALFARWDPVQLDRSLDSQRDGLPEKYRVSYKLLHVRSREVLDVQHRLSQQGVQGSDLCVCIPEGVTFQAILDTALGSELPFHVPEDHEDSSMTMARLQELVAEQAKIRLAFLAANPIDRRLDQLRGDIEYREIEDALRAGGLGERFDVRPSLALRAEDLLRVVHDEGPWTILHFSGHGTPSSQIVVQGENESPRAVPHHVLENLVRDKNGLRCVVLNACFSEAQAELLSQHVDFVVGMVGEVKDCDAVLFSRVFYGVLANGESVEVALSRTKEVLSIERGPKVASRVTIRARHGADGSLL